MKKILSILILVGLFFTGCSNAPVVERPESTVESTVVESTMESTTEESTVEESSVEESTEEVHEHIYTEVVVEATCEEVGSITYTCECGESYEEEIPAKGHNFGDYIYNEDATYTEDGTKTATCVCGKEDVVVAEGTKLEYTFEDIEKTMYCVEGSNLRDMPTDDGKKAARLSKGSKVTVTGICNETDYYRVEHEGEILYTLKSNLSETKPVEAPTTTPNTNTTPSTTPNTTPNTNTNSNQNTNTGNGETSTGGNTGTTTPPEVVSCVHPGGHQMQRCDASKSYTIDLSTGAVITDTTGKCWQDYNYYITYCDLCGEVLSENLTPAGGQHCATLIPRIAPTCTTDGYSTRNSCPCGACNDEGRVLPATGHNFVTEMTGNMNNENYTIEYKRYCLACGLVDSTWWE